MATIGAGILGSVAGSVVSNMMSGDSGGGGGGGGGPIRIPQIPVPDPTALIGAQTAANRANIYTPFGALTYSGPNKENSHLSLSPQQQLAVSRALNYANTSPYDTGTEGAVDAYYRSGLSRLRPQFDQQEARLRDDLTQRGIPASGADLAPAAVSDLDVLNRSRNDALVQLDAAAQQMGAQRRLADIQGTATRSAMLNQAAQAFDPRYLFGVQPAPVDVLGAYGLQQNAHLGQLNAQLGAQGVNAQYASDRQGGKQNLFGSLGSAGISAMPWGSMFGSSGGGSGGGMVSLAGDSYMR